MSNSLVNEVRKGFYLDSVALMRMSRELAGLPGVEEAAMMMGTPSNREVMRTAGLLADAGDTAHGSDLIIGIRAVSETAGRDALAAALELLARPRGSAGVESFRPRSLDAAVNALPGANLALISVAGDFAAAEARRALRRGLHVMMFSDNVTLADERSLKQEARERGLLMMGPDCGTAIINGVPLAFANAVPRGDIGIIGASGTGMQEIAALIAQHGGGISQAIGVGGRDVKQDIGGIMTLMAIDALDADPATRHVVLVSKPPHAEVAACVLARIAASDKAFTVCFIGGADDDMPANAHFAATLRDAAEHALGGVAIGAGFDAAASAAERRRPGSRVEGLFCGGTLCAEAQIVLRANGREPVSNAPVPGAGGLDGSGEADRLIDLGADEYTRGRPHPMIDPSVRDDALRAALLDGAVGVVLVDLVIGYGAHEDPAGQLVEVLAVAADDGPVVVASVTGTDSDPQVRSQQQARLERAGVLVAPCNAQASELAAAIVAVRE